MIEAHGLVKRYGSTMAVKRPVFLHPAGPGHRFPWPERRREDHYDADDPGPGRADAGLGNRSRAQLPRPAGAIACLMAILFVLPGIAQALPDSWRNPVTEFWPTQAGGQLTSVHQSAHTLP